MFGDLSAFFPYKLALLEFPALVTGTVHMSLGMIRMATRGMRHLTGPGMSLGEKFIKVKVDI